MFTIGIFIQNQQWFDAIDIRDSGIFSANIGIFFHEIPEKIFHSILRKWSVFMLRDTRLRIALPIDLSALSNYRNWTIKISVLGLNKCIKMTYDLWWICTAFKLIYFISQSILILFNQRDRSATLNALLLWYFNRRKISLVTPRWLYDWILDSTRSNVIQISKVQFIIYTIQNLFQI
jgi:hypothetical protein